MLLFVLRDALPFPWNSVLPELVASYVTNDGHEAYSHDWKARVACHGACQLPFSLLDSDMLAEIKALHPNWEIRAYFDRRKESSTYIQLDYEYQCRECGWQLFSAFEKRREAEEDDWYECIQCASVCGMAYDIHSGRAGPDDAVVQSNDHAYVPWRCRPFANLAFLVDPAHPSPLLPASRPVKHYALSVPWL